MSILLALSFTLGACSTWRAAREYQRGSEALVQGDAARAIVHLEAAAQLAPERAEVHDHLGVAYARAGRLDDAVRALEHAVALDCTNTSAARHLAIARADRDALNQPAGP